MKPCSAAFGWAWTGSAAKAAMTAAMARVMNFVMNWSFLNVGYDREPHAMGGNIGENSLPLQLPGEGTRAALSRFDGERLRFGERAPGSTTAASRSTDGEHRLRWWRVPARHRLSEWRRGGEGGGIPC